MNHSHEPDENMREHLIEYLHRTITDECKAHIEATYIFGSFAGGRVTRESDVDVFFVMEEYDYPAKGDVNMVAMANVPEAVEQGLGKQPGDWWSGTKYWGVGPEEATEQIPEYLVRSMRNVIGTQFSTDVSGRWVDIFFGTRGDLESYAEQYEEIQFP